MSIPNDRKEEFNRFLETGEASEDFLDWLESSPEAKGECEAELRSDLKSEVIGRLIGGDTNAIKEMADREDRFAETLNHLGLPSGSPEANQCLKYLRVYEAVCRRRKND